MKTITIGLASLLMTSLAQAAGGYLVTGATVSNVFNTSANLPQFAITVAGGTGPCANTTIVFPQSSAPDADTFKRAYAQVLLALTNGMHINVYNFTDVTCNFASYINLYQ